MTNEQKKAAIQLFACAVVGLKEDDFKVSGRFIVLPQKVYEKLLGEFEANGLDLEIGDLKIVARAEPLVFPEFRPMQFSAGEGDQKAEAGDAYFPTAGDFARPDEATHLVAVYEAVSL